MKTLSGPVAQVAPMFVGTVFLGIGGWQAYAGLAGGEVEIFGVLFGAAFAAAGAFAIAMGVRPLLARSAFAEAHLEVLAPVPLGGTMRAMLVLEPKRPVTLVPPKCTATLRTTERAEYSAGTDSRTYVESLYSAVRVLELPQFPQGRLERPVEFAVPRDIPPSWSGTSNHLETVLQVHVEIDRWPDLDLEARVKVLPEVAS